MFVQGLHGAMEVDRLFRKSFQLRQHPLRLAEGVTEEQRSDAALPIRAPPAHDFLHHLRRRRPSVDGQREGRFADEHVALELLEGGAGRVRLSLVVAGDHPDRALVLDANLRGAEDVPGRVQRNLGFTEAKRRPVIDRRDGIARCPAVTGDRRARTCENVARAAVAEMIPMRVRDHRGLYRLPGVDVEIPGRAVETAIRADDERCGA